MSSENSKLAAPYWIEVRSLQSEIMYDLILGLSAR